MADMADAGGSPTSPPAGTVASGSFSLAMGVARSSSFAEARVTRRLRNLLRVVRCLAVVVGTAFADTRLADPPARFARAIKPDMALVCSTHCTPRDFNASSTSSKISIKDLLRERLTASKFVWPRARRARVEARARGSTLGERGAEQAVKSTSHAARERKERERERGRRRERERRCSLELRGPPRASGLLRASAMVPVAAQSPRWRGTPSLSRAPRAWSAGSS